jgi:hypothetical protein
VTRRVSVFAVVVVVVVVVVLLRAIGRLHTSSIGSIDGSPKSWSDHRGERAGIQIIRPVQRRHECT